MNEKRKAVEAYILKSLSKIDTSGKNAEQYRKKFEAMSDAQFHQFMLQLKEHKTVLVLYEANMVDKLSIDNLKEVAKDFGIELFERLRIWDEPTQTYYLTPNKYMIVQLPVRRMSQFVDHKLSVAEGDTKIDLLTGQVVKPDKAGSISQVEIQTLYARGLEKTILEILKYRGGDVVALAEYRRELEEQGRTSIDRDTGSVVRSAVILDVFLSGMHIESNASGV